MSYRFVDSFPAGPGWNWKFHPEEVSSSICTSVGMIIVSNETNTYSPATAAHFSNEMCWTNSYLFISPCTNNGKSQNMFYDNILITN